MTQEEAINLQGQINNIGDSIAAGDDAATVSNKIETAKKSVDGLVDKKSSNSKPTTPATDTK